MDTLTKRHFALENTILLLVLVNLALPWFDPQHPGQWVYDAFALTFQWWIEAIGWVMSWTDPLLPRTFTFRGVGNLVFAVSLTGLAIFLLYAIWSQLCKRIWFRQIVRRAQFPFSKMRRNVWALSFIVVLLLAALAPTLVRLAAGQLFSS